MPAINGSNLYALRALLVVFALITSVGCASFASQLPSSNHDQHPYDPFYHTLTFNWRGEPVDPSGNTDCQPRRGLRDAHRGLQLCQGTHSHLRPLHTLSWEDYQVYLDHVFEAREEYVRWTGNPRVLIFVHGGVNSLHESIERALRLHECIEGLTVDCAKDRANLKQQYFPIFINWQSSLVASYGDHLSTVKRGAEWLGARDWALAPLYLIADTLRAAERAPRTWWSQWEKDLASLPLWPSREKKNIQQALETLQPLDRKKASPLRMAYAGGCSLTLIEQDPEGDCRTWWERQVTPFGGLLTLPVKTVALPFIESFGTSVWDSMQRRTNRLFHLEEDICAGDGCTEAAEGHPPNLTREPGIGGLSLFMRRLREEVGKSSRQWDITLIGHSMGAQVLNEMIQRFGDLTYRNIVYMAAACSIRDYQESVFPHLSREEHKDTRVYHLMLHPEAEHVDSWGETMLGVDLPPRGSPLVWIDRFLNRPETRLDRMVGRWSNLAVALPHTPPALRDRISVKVFRAGEALEETDPQRHRHFTTFPFWQSSFWSGYTRVGRLTGVLSE